MVPLNGALGRLFFKIFLVLTLIFFLLWTISQRSQSAIELEHIQQRFHYAEDQLDSLRAQIDVITRHKGKIENLLAEERERFAQNNKDQQRRISHLEAENSRLGKALSQLNRENHNEQQHNNQLNDTGKAALDGKQHKLKEFETIQQKNDVDGQKAEDDPFENGHQIRAPLIHEEEKKEQSPNDEEHKEKEVNEDVGAEKDYVFEREKPREELIFHRRANVSEGGDERRVQKLLPGKELTKKLAERMVERNHKHVEDVGEEEFGVVRADG